MKKQVVLVAVVLFGIFFNMQKRILDAGHWEAYKFLEWLYENPLTLDAKHSVSRNNVKSVEAKFNLIREYQCIGR